MSCKFAQTISLGICLLLASESFATEKDQLLAKEKEHKLSVAAAAQAEAFGGVGFTGSIQHGTGGELSATTPSGPIDEDRLRLRIAVVVFGESAGLTEAQIQESQKLIEIEMAEMARSKKIDDAIARYAEPRRRSCCCCVFRRTRAISEV